MDSEAAPGLNAGQPGIEKSRRIEDLHDLRLKTLLDDLVDDNAASRPTADLDVTLTASQENERLTRRVRVAPGRAPLAGGRVGGSGKGRGTAGQLILVNFFG